MWAKLSEERGFVKRPISRLRIAPVASALPPDRPGAPNEPATTPIRMIALQQVSFGYDPNGNMATRMDAAARRRLEFSSSI